MRRMAAADAKEAAAIAQTAQQWREALRPPARAGGMGGGGRRAAGDDAGGAAAGSTDGSVERFEHLELRTLAPAAAPRAQPGGLRPPRGVGGPGALGWLKEAALRGAEAVAVKCLVGGAQEALAPPIDRRRRHGRRRR